MPHEHPAQGKQKHRRLYLKPEPRPQTTPWTWPSLIAAGGLAGGFICPVLGGLFTALGWLRAPGPNATFLSRLGTFLLLLTIPLLVLGTYYIDLADQAEKRRRAALQATLRDTVAPEDSKQDAAL